MLGAAAGLVDVQLMLDLVEIHGLVLALVLEILLLLVNTQEEAHTSAHDLVVGAQRGLLHDFNRPGIIPHIALPQLSGQLDSPQATRGGEIVLSGLDQLKQNRLDRLVELVVLDLVIGVAHIRDDAAVDVAAHLLAGGGGEDGEQGLQQLRRRDNVLVSEQNQTLHQLLPQVGIQRVVLLQQQQR